MKTADVIKHFGTQARVAEELQIKQPSVSAWGDRPPILRQLEIEELTKGKLKADPLKRKKATRSRKVSGST